MHKRLITVGSVLLAIALSVLLFTGAANIRVGGNDIFVTQTLSLDANATAQALDTAFIGSYLYQARIESTADDAVTFTVNAGSLTGGSAGAQLVTKTTTSATTGEIAVPSGAFYAITDTPVYTISGVDSGTVYVKVVSVRK